MENELRLGCARIAAARARQLETRMRRNEQVSRLRHYLQAQFGDFVGAVDPVTGARLVELLAEGSKAKGDLVLTVALFEGSKLRFAVNAVGSLDCIAVPAQVLTELGSMIELTVAEDLASAELVFEADDAAKTRRTLDARDLVERLIEVVATNVERDAGLALAAAR